MAQMGCSQPSAWASPTNLVLHKEDNAEDNVFEDESHVEYDQMSQITLAQRPPILPYPKYDQVQNNKFSDPGLVSLEPFWAEDDFHSAGRDNASYPELMLDSASLNSVQRMAGFKEVLSNIISVLSVFPKN